MNPQAAPDEVPAERFQEEYDKLSLQLISWAIDESRFEEGYEALIERYSLEVTCLLVRSKQS